MSNSENVTISDDRYYVSEDEAPQVSLVEEKLTGSKYFFTWKRLMEISLFTKSKLGFVTGEYKKPDDLDTLEKWKRCDALVWCWLKNSMSENLAKQVLYSSSDAAGGWKTLHDMYCDSDSSKFNVFVLKRECWSMVQEELEDVESYFRELNKRWTELDCVRRFNASGAENCEGCKASLKEDEEERGLKFLTGLNDTHAVIKACLLIRKERPNVRELYQIVLMDEKRRAAKKSYNEISEKYSNLQITADSSLREGSGSHFKNRKMKF